METSEVLNKIEEAKEQLDVLSRDVNNADAPEIRRGKNVLLGLTTGLDTCLSTFAGEIEEEEAE